MDSILVLCELTPLGNVEPKNRKYIIMINLVTSRQLCRSLSRKRVHDLSEEGLISNLMMRLNDAQQNQKGFLMGLCVWGDASVLLLQMHLVYLKCICLKYAECIVNRHMCEVY